MANLFHKNPESGQTLIETMVATFLLAMGITAAIGLAIYALATSNNVVKQITAIGLAREGVEAVKNMRDTNWLKGAPIGSTCHNFQTGASDAPCYPNWLTSLYNIDPGSATTTYRLVFRPNPAGNPWTMVPATSGWGLNLDLATTSAPFAGFYDVPNTDMSSGLTDGSSDYYRRIVLSTDTQPPYDQNTGPRLRVASQVWWTGKNCPRVQNWPGKGKCAIELVTYLTNWKDFQP